MAKSWMWLCGLVLIVLFIRLFFAFQTPFLSSDSSYLHVRAIESLLQGKLLWNDSLGYGGRMLMVSPIFDAVLAFFALFMPLSLVLKLIPNIFASLLVLPAFFLSYRLTKNKVISLCSAFLASIVPAFFANTFNQVVPVTLAIPIFFCLLYIWLEIPKKTMLFLGVLLFFVFLHPLSIVFVLSLGVYIALATLDLKPHPAEYELGLFAIFFTLWAQFLLYKRLILVHGLEVIWQNIPTALLSSFYANVTVLQAIVQIGVYPLGEGIYAIYRTAFKNPQKDIHMLLSVTIVSGCLLWLKLIDIATGFMLLGITLAIMFAKWSALFLQYMQKTKISSFAKPALIVSFLLAIISTGIPMYTAVQDQLRGAITQEEVSALKNIASITPANSTIIAPPFYGHYVTYFAKRKNVIDDYFFLQPEINERYEDVARTYALTFETEAVSIFDKYGAGYLIVPPGMKDIKYAGGTCFKRIYATNIRVYEKNPACAIRVVA